MARTRLFALAMALMFACNIIGIMSANAFEPNIVNLGIYTGDGPESMADIEKIENKLGSRFSIIQMYTGFNQEFSTFKEAKLFLLTRSDSIALVSWAPGTSQGVLYRQIASGALDPYLTRWAQGARQWQKPILLRFAYEMNMTNMAWNGTNSNGGPQAFIAAWRHMHDIFQQQGATNVKWVWCPHADHQSPYYTNEAQYYPGNDVVDWIGLDGYYWGGANGQEAQSFDRIFKASYESLKQYGKPMMIAEMGAPAEDKADPAAWLKAANQRIQADYPQFKAVVYFNMDFSHRGEKDWRFSQRQDTCQVMQQIMALNPKGK